MSLKLVDKTIRTDVLIVGSEGAGSTAAIEAKRKGADVMIVTKGKMGKSGATETVGGDLRLDGRSMYELGLPGDPEDSKEKYFDDIVECGLYLNNQKIVNTFVNEAKDRVKDLLDWGLKRRPPKGDPREIRTTGRYLTDALRRGVKEHSVGIIEDTMITDLLTTNGKVVGAIGIDILTGEVVRFKAKAVVLATGGLGNLYSFTSNPTDLTGDGMAMAYRAGAELVNMEFMQFIPFILLWPPSHRGSVFGYLLYAFCGGWLLDHKGKRVMTEYEAVSHEEKSILSQAMQKIVNEGRGSSHGGLWYSLKTTPWNIVERNLTFAPDGRYQGGDFSGIIENLKEGGALETGVAAHYSLGGIKINENCETCVAGLYASGECSSGLHGSNRAEAAATTEMVVTGAVAGKSAARYAKKAGEVLVQEKNVKRLRNKIIQPLRLKEGVNGIALKKRIQELADRSVGIIKEGRVLKEAILEVEKIKKEMRRVCVTTKSMEYNKELIDALQVGNLLQVLEASVKASLYRKESRGAHYRLDYPDMDHDNWLKEVVAKHVDGKMQMFTTPVVVTNLRLPTGKMTYKEALRLKNVKV